MKKGHKHKRLELGETELNLVPMLDLFLSLIPFLLISAVFLNYGGLLVSAPSLVQAESVVDKPVDIPKTQEINLLCKVEGNSVTISAYSKGFLSKLDNLGGSFALSDREGLQQFISKLMEKHSKIASVLFKATPTTKYENAVAVLNTFKTMKVSNNVVLAVRAIE